MHRVAVVALPGVISFDLGIPCEVFGRARGAGGELLYEVRVCGSGPRVPADHFELRVRAGLEALAAADTIVIPGVADVSRPVPRDWVEALRAAHARGARLASVCSGAFVLAATGLLAGRRATTHWAAADELALRHPAIEVDPRVLFVDDGEILTSAGAASGIDLCLHLVRRDHGAAVAAAAARLAVVPLEREGGQAQFIAPEPAPHDGASLTPLLEWIDANLERDLSLEALARRAAMSTRTLSRRFREQLGSSPAQWVSRRRIRRSQELLETTAHSIERVASLSGFASVSSFRARFQQTVGNAPQSYRKMFRGS